MSLERTVLDLKSIKELLKTNYKLDVKSIQKSDLGTANCYIVSDGTNKYFLKEFQRDFSRDDLIREAEIVKHLANKGIPTAKYIKTVSKDYFIEYKEHLICLEEYIDGETYGYNDFPKSMMNELARMLGKIHNALVGYELPKDMGDEWIHSFSEDKESQKYQELIDILERNRADKYYKQIKYDLIYKQQLLSRGNDYIRFFNGITYMATHGDYQGCQLICEGEHIKAIIDFSSARTLPVVWEIMRSYVQSSKYSRNEAKIDADDFCEYVGEYLKYSKLSEKDLEAMPYVYLFQLARSKYGYPQYLTTDSEDREGLLEFAFWRTNICREVEVNTELIIQKLKRLC